MPWTLDRGGQSEVPVVAAGDMSWGDFEPVTPEKIGFLCSQFSLFTEFRSFLGYDSGQGADPQLGPCCCGSFFDSGGGAPALKETIVHPLLKSPSFYSTIFNNL